MLHIYVFIIEKIICLGKKNLSKDVEDSTQKTTKHYLEELKT